MSTGMKMLSLLVALVAADGTSVQEAAGAPFPVVACDDAASGSAGSWSEVRTAPGTQLTSATACPSESPDPYGSLDDGLAVGDVVNAWDEAPPDGAFAEWRFTAPAGTSITTISVARDIGNRDEWTPYGRIDGVDQAGESCMPGPGQAFCRIQGRRVFGGLDARTVAYGIRCVTAPYCAHLWDLRAVWVLVLGATVTLEDRQVPAVSALDVTGVGGGGWWNRAGSVSFSASDNTGVRRRRVLVGGVSRASVDAPGASAGGCGQVGVGVAYSYSRPCADARGLNGLRSVAVDPCGWGDGVHSVRGTAVDTGGLEAATAAAATVRVDCTAPAVSLAPGASEVLGGETVETPVVEASDAASGVAATITEISIDGGPWLDATAAPVVAEAGRVYLHRARARDAAGNWSAWAVSDPVVGVAPAPEIPMPEPADPVVVAGGPAPALPAPPVEVLVSTPESEAPRRADPPEAPEPLRPTPRREDPLVRITHVLTRGRTVTIRGTAAPALRTTGRVTLRSGSGRGRTRRRAIAVAGGRWRARFAVRRGRGARAATVTTRATATHADGSHRWRAPRNRPSPLR